MTTNVVAIETDQYGTETCIVPFAQRLELGCAAWKVVSAERTVEVCQLLNKSKAIARCAYPLLRGT